MQPAIITRHISQRAAQSGSRARASAVPTSTLGFALFAVVVLALAFALLSGPGCVSTPQGLQRWDRFYTAATNDLAVARPIVTSVTPPPWNSVVEAVLGLVTAGLTTWNLQQHRRLAALEAATTPAPTAPSPTP